MSEGTKTRTTTQKELSGEQLAGGKLNNEKAPQLEPSKPTATYVEEC